MHRDFHENQCILFPRSFTGLDDIFEANQGQDLRIPHPAVRFQDFCGISYQTCEIPCWRPERLLVHHLGNCGAGCYLDLCTGSIGTLNAHLHQPMRHGFQEDLTVVVLCLRLLRLSFHLSLYIYMYKYEVPHHEACVIVISSLVFMEVVGSLAELQVLNNDILPKTYTAIPMISAPSTTVSCTWPFLLVFTLNPVDSRT